MVHIPTLDLSQVLRHRGQVAITTGNYMKAGGDDSLYPRGTVLWVHTAHDHSAEVNLSKDVDQGSDNPDGRRHVRVEQLVPVTTVTQAAAGDYLVATRDVTLLGERVPRLGYAKIIDRDTRHLQVTTGLGDVWLPVFEIEKSCVVLGARFVDGPGEAVFEDEPMLAWSFVQQTVTDFAASLGYPRHGQNLLALLSPQPETEVVVTVRVRGDNPGKQVSDALEAAGLDSFSVGGPTGQ